MSKKIVARRDTSGTGFDVFSVRSLALPLHRSQVHLFPPQRSFPGWWHTNCICRSNSEPFFNFSPFSGGQYASPPPHLPITSSHLPITPSHLHINPPPNHILPLPPQPISLAYLVVLPFRSGPLSINETCITVAANDTSPPQLFVLRPELNETGWIFTNFTLAGASFQLPDLIFVPTSQSSAFFLAESVVSRTDIWEYFVDGDGLQHWAQCP